MSNRTSHGDATCDSVIYDRNIFPILYFVIFPEALLLNVVAAWVSLHLKSTTSFVVFLKNLVVADLIMTLIIPIHATSGLAHAPNSLLIITCRYSSVVFYSTLYTCVTFLGLISLDRFFKIMSPQGKFFGHSVTPSKVISASVWLVLFGGKALPTIFLSNKPVTTSTKISTCMLLKGPAGLEFHRQMVLIVNGYFWFVSVVIVVCYICIANKVIRSFRKSGSSNTQGSQKVQLRVFLVVIVFFASFGPYHIVRFPYTFQQMKNSKRGCYIHGRFTKDLSLWITSINLCLDPLLYVFLCREFREKLICLSRALFKQRFGCRF